MKEDQHFINCMPIQEHCLNDLPSHTVNAFLEFDRFRKNETFCDISIKIGKRIFNAHKIVLSAVCPYFNAMLTSQMLESNSDSIELYDIDESTFEKLLDYMYTSSIKIVEENVLKLLPAANLLQIASVKSACCSFLKKQIEPSNALGILGFADMHLCASLVKTVESFVLQNFLQVCLTEEFYSLSFERVKFLISNDNLVVDEEEDVYDALIRWIKHSPENRNHYFADLLKYVKLPLMRREFLTVTVEPEELIKNCNKSKDMLIEAMKYHLTPEIRRYNQSEYSTKSRTLSGGKPMIYVLGGQSLFGIHCECEAMLENSQSWVSIPSMINRRARLGVGAVNNKLYVIGGFDGTNDLSSIEVFNTRTRTWSSVVNNEMGINRSCLGVAVLHNLIYAIGGYDGSSCLSSVERFDPLTQQWTSVAKMATKRRYLSVGVVDEYILAVGGFDGKHHLCSCEVYDPVTNYWTTKSPMQKPRSSAAACFLNGFFYISGGADGSFILSTVEQYNFSTDTWVTILPMKNLRMTHALVALNGKLYAIGGCDGATSLNSVEVYTPDSDWVSIGCMGTRRSHVTAIVMTC